MRAALLKPWTLLSQSKGLQQSLLMVVGNTAATGFSAVAVIIISRLVSPEVFGEFSVAFAIVMVLARLSDWGFNSAIHSLVPNAKTKADQAAICNYILTWRLVLGGTMSLLALVASPWITELFKLSNYWLVPVAVTIGLITLLYEQFLFTLQALQKFAWAVGMNAIQSSAKMAGTIFFWLAAVTNINLIFGWYALAPGLGVLGSLREIPPPQVQFRISPQHRQAIWVIARNSALFFMANGLIQDIGVLFVQYFLNDFETGLLGGTARIALLFYLVANSLSQVLFPRASTYHHKSDQLTFLKKSWGVVGLTLLGYLAVLPLSRYFIEFTIGPAYLSGTPILMLLIGSVFFYIATVPFLALFYSTNNTWFFSLHGLLLIIGTLAGNMLLIPTAGLMGAAWAQVATRGTLFVLTVVASHWVVVKTK